MQFGWILSLIVLALGLAAVVHALVLRSRRAEGSGRTLGRLLMGAGFITFGAGTLALPDSDLVRLGAIALALFGTVMMTRSRDGERHGA